MGGREGRQRQMGRKGGGRGVRKEGRGRER